MPQLDFATYPSQFLWLLLIFLLQYIVMSKVIVPGFTKIYRERQNYIEKEVALAEKLIKKAESLKNDYETNLLAAKEKHAKIVNQTIAELQKNVENKIGELEVKLSAELKQQEAELRNLEKEAKKELETIAIHSASLIINKMTKQKIDNKSLNKYIN